MDNNEKEKNNKRGNGQREGKRSSNFGSRTKL